MNQQTTSNSTPSADVTGRQIAIVGCGPRGLYCLERLCYELFRCNGTGPSCQPHHITIVEPAEHCGAGAVYDLDQPAWLRMNFAAKHIDAWCRNDSLFDDELNLVDWLADRGDGHGEPEAFMPRAVVGRYLHDCFCKVVDRLSLIAEISIVRQSVTDVFQNEGRWRITGTEGYCVDAEEVVITVGHEGWRESTIAASEGVSGIELTPVFPVNIRLHLSTIPAASVVAVRGFGLSWIDAALSLTIGRGGKFDKVGDQLKYYPSGSEPKCIIPFSRSGRPMLAKPLTPRIASGVDLARIWQRGRTQISEIAAPLNALSIGEQFWPVVSQCARAAWSLVNRQNGHEPSDGSPIDEFFELWCCGKQDAATVADAMRRSVAIALGQHPVDAAWALAEAWRHLYPATVEKISHGGLSAEAWPAFTRIAQEMERIAFGPPAENLRRILALIDAGIIDLRFVSGELGLTAEQQPRLRAEYFEMEITHCVNAVIPSPLNVSQNGPLAPLLKRGVIRRLHGTQGIEVDSKGQPVNDGKTDTAGLAILGRPTEGCILGNDTLSRTLHQHVNHWAASVVQRGCPVLS
ncbi:FAD/NAD(P)-binding protein [Aureliella helgolandensis]|uniref:FAD-dependent urate hydroxylase HpyO/Asp monooxygenase CreE-like FAD/NAD(P)-binding domain-containing protein n=1 Tax=Aureliella helgolandensis TaxID=2527968 RepID=A0A518G4U1_9BACT|nr:FAD/NAD(P)-binding domain-containing protein [Aureliella helgolandensis]QDV23618.1 hypothetical protein Q31a_19210 [Aureliella helgolandensis]